MSERFYVSSPLGPGPVELEGAEAHHLSAVCRLRPGDQVCLFNGDGADYPATVIDVGKRHVSLDVTSRLDVNRELSMRLEVAAPLPKGDRAQFLIEKLTEIGVTSFVPLLCERAVVQPRENTLEKLQRYVIEASKQCGRNMLMAIEPPAEWSAYAVARPNEVRLFAHPTGRGTVGQGGNCRCVVGPEGGFTSVETEFAERHGWQMIDLGPRILRIETAALVMAMKARP